MPPNVYEEELNLHTPVLEPVTLTRENAAVFPFVPLRATGDFQPKAFRVYVLENEFLRAEICPDLGGRLVSLFDKRDQTSPVPRPDSLAVRPGGHRGVVWDHGIIIDIPGRANDLGPLDAFPRESEAEGEPAAVFLFDRHGDFSWHACWSLSDGRAELTFELQVLNRSLVPAMIDVNLTTADACRIIGSHGPGRRLLMPRRTAAFTFRVIPALGFSENATYGRTGIAEYTEDLLRFRSTIRCSGSNLHIVGSQASMTARADLDPEVELTAHVEGLGDLLRIELEDDVLSAPAIAERLPSQVENLWLRPESGTAEDALIDEAKALWENPLGERHSVPTVAGAEHLTKLLGALNASAQGRHTEADRLLDEYLGLNAEDSLAWWLKAVLAARVRPSEQEVAEAMNAHFLAPLEPVLRVQSFLAQGPGQGRDPNPLMRPLAADPEAAVDAVHQLLLAGLLEEAHQLLDELLRHRPNARLHILAAWMFLRRSRMAFESAHHAQAAADLAPEPPFPNRAFEFLALREVSAAHPLAGLKAWADLEFFAGGRR